jgi:Zn-dependent peptidase ImmA (M78 family)
MILQKRHIIARKVADEFRGRLLLTHTELLEYPLQYVNLQIAICEHFGIIVDEMPNLSIRKIKAKLSSLNLPLEAESYDEYLQLAGFLYASDGAVIIFIEQMDSEERKKFTLAHEIAHFLNEYFKLRLKLKQANQMTLPLFESGPRKSPTFIAKRCTKNDVFSAIYGQAEPDFEVGSNPVSLVSLLAQKQMNQDSLREKICDWFAAEVLMPVDMLKRLEPQWIDQRMTLDAMSQAVQENFLVSFQAAQVRVKELKLGNILQDGLF